jgi:hypothetical protein
MQATLAFYSDHNAAVMILQKGLKSTVGQTESKASFQNNLYLGEETPRLQVGWMKEESHGVSAMGVSMVSVNPSSKSEKNRAPVEI